MVLQTGGTAISELATKLFLNLAGFIQNPARDELTGADW